MEKLSEKVINVGSIAAASTVWFDKEIRSLTKIGITSYIKYHGSATAGVRVWLLTAPRDESTFDTEATGTAWRYYDPTFVAGSGYQQTEQYEIYPYELRVKVRNLDAVNAVSTCKFWLTYNIAL